MFEFLSSANKSTVQSQIEYFERALKESKSQDAYYDRRASFPDETSSNEAIRRPSEESIGKAREWIAVQRKDYPDSKEILDLCKRWEELFDAYQKKMKAERAAIQAQGAEARAQMKAGNGKASPNGVKNFDGGEGRYGYRVDTGWGKKGGPAPKAETVVVGADGTAAPADAKPDEGKPSETVVAQASAELSGDFPRQFNESHLKEFKDRIDKVIAKLAPLATEEGSKDVKNLAELRAISAALDAVLKNPDVAAVTKLQEAILAVLKDAKFTKGRNDGKPDGLFGPITMENLEKAVNLAKESADAQAVPAGSAPSATPGNAAPAAPAPTKPSSGGVEFKDSGKIRREFAYSKGGKVYILGKDGTPEIVRVETFPKELVAQLEKAEAVGGKFADLFFLLSAYQAAYPKANFGKRAAEIQAEVAKAAPGDVPALEKILAKYLAVFTTDEKNEEKIQEIFASSSEPDRKARLFAFVRSELGQYDLVSSAISERAMADMDIGPEEMAKLTALARQYPDSPKKALEALKASGALAERLRVNAGYGNDEKAYLGLFRRLSDAYVAAKSNLSKSDAQISEQLRETLTKENRLQDFDKEKSALEGRVLEQFLSAAAAKEILTLNVSKRGNQNRTEYEIFGKIEGIGAFVPSDRTVDIGKEIGILVATELAAFAVGALTVGAGAWAVNAAVYGSRGIRLAERAEWIGAAARSTNVLAKSARWTAGTAMEGVLFYEGANLAQNVIERRDWFEGAGNQKEMLKSMLFVGALKGFAKVSAKIPGLAVKEADGLAMVSVKSATRVTLEGLAIGGIGNAIEVTFENGEWTREQFVEGIMMALMFRALGRAKNSLILKPKADGTVAVAEEIPAPKAPAAAEPVRDARKAEADAIRSLRSKIKEKKAELSESRRLLEGGETAAATSAQLKNRIFTLEREIASMEREIGTRSAYAPKKSEVAAAESATGALREKASIENDVKENKKKASEETDPAKKAELEQKQTALEAELREAEALAAKGVKAPETLAEAAKLNEKAADVVPKAMGRKIDFAQLLPTKAVEGVKARYDHLSHGIGGMIKATPGKAWDITSSVLFGNTHGGFVNKFLSAGKGPVFAEHGHGGDAHHKKPFPTMMVLTLATNEALKINDAGGFKNWAEELFTLHGVTAETIDLVASFLFVKNLGWARMLAANSMSEKYLDDDDWSTNWGSRAADWMWGAPAEAKKK